MRLYHWVPSCISLGHHQDSGSIDLDRCQEEGIDVVRRPTGGRAVFHAEEITYAVILPPGAEGGDTIRSVYRMIGTGLVCGLRKLGVPAQLERRPLNFHTHYRSALSVSCFSAAARDEIVLGGRKLVGSAQRRLPNGILQHGSILLGDAHLRLPEFFRDVDSAGRLRMREEIAWKTVSIRSALNRIIPFEEGAEALRSGMEEALDIRFETGGPTVAETSLMETGRRHYAIVSRSVIRERD